jgi:tetratricopeptide (TPR) repeat protein
MIFGFVLGYMAAGLGDVPASDPRPRPRAEASAPTAPGGADAPAGDTSPAAGHDHPVGRPIRDEVRTLENLAARDKQNVQVRIELGNLLHGPRPIRRGRPLVPGGAGLKPADNDVRVDLGASLLNLGRGPDALAEFDQALKNDPGHKKALFNKGLALMQSGRPKDAVASGTTS